MAEPVVITKRNSDLKGSNLKMAEKSRVIILALAGEELFVFLTASKGCSEVNKAKPRPPSCLSAFGDMILGFSVSVCVRQ